MIDSRLAAIGAAQSLQSIVVEDAVNPAAGVRPSRTQICLVGGLLLAYALLSHYSESGGAPRGFGVVLSYGPVVLISVVLAWRWTRPWIALIGAALAGAAIFHYWEFLERHYEAADLVQQCGAYGLIALSFAHSLFRVPLCTRLAQELHGALDSREIAYTRVATTVWAVFYLLIAAVIAVLYFAATQRTWSLFVNFGTFGLIGAACLVDYLLRRWLLPRRPGDGVLTMLRRALVG